MSTILDSLKKSSNQRDDGQQKSSIDNFNFVNSNNTKKSNSYVFLILLLLFILAIVYWGYNYFNISEFFQKETDYLQTSQQIKVPKDIVAVDNTTTDRLPRKEKPNNSEVKQRIKDLKRKKQKEQRQTSKNEPKKVRQLPIVTSGKEVGNIRQEAPKLKLELSKNKKQTSMQKPVEKKPKLQTQVKQQEHTYIYQLPFIIRKDIPKLTLNIHVFDESPENCIVIINGARFLVDEMIEEQILIKEIVREGVVLEFNNHEFLIPKL